MGRLDMTIKTICAAIKTRLSTISGLRVYKPEEITEGMPECPAVVIIPPKNDYHRSHDGQIESKFRLTLFLQKQDLGTAMGQIIDYVDISGANSIPYALEGDRSLGGTASDIICKSSSETTAFTDGGVDYLSIEFEVTVIS
jgi:hypothetical protein